MRALIILVMVFSLISASAGAVRVQELPLVSKIHLGVVTGIGGGINFGFNAAFKLFDVNLGLELEQVISDVEYSSSVNGTRYGGLLNIPLTKDLSLNLHMGSFGFQVSKADINYTINGSSQTLIADENYSGKYQALSLDYRYAGFLFSPKLVLNIIDGKSGTIQEFDFNIGRAF